jgi:8-oxo-dGTP diphosphatase
MEENIMLAADAVIFNKLDGKLKVLLIKRKKEPFKGMSALLGMFVKKGERPEDALTRKIFLDTGLTRIKLIRMKSYGNKDRDPRGIIITIVFVAEFNSDEIIKNTDDITSASWVEVTKLPKLGFDHEKIIEDAMIFAKRKGLLK